VSTTILGASALVVVAVAGAAVWMALKMRRRSREIAGQIASIHASLDHQARKVAAAESSLTQLTTRLRTLADAEAELRSNVGDAAHRLDGIEAADAGERLAVLEAYPLSEGFERLGRLENEFREIRRRDATAAERLAQIEGLGVDQRLTSLEEQRAGERLQLFESRQLDDRLRLLEGFASNDRLLVLEELARVKKAASVVAAAWARGDLDREVASPTLDELLELEEALLADGSRVDDPSSD